MEEVWGGASGGRPVACLTAHAAVPYLGKSRAGKATVARPVSSCQLASPLFSAHTKKAKNGS